MKWVRFLVGWLTAGVLFLHAGSLPARPEEEWKGTVTAVYDGDTILVGLESGRSEKVRLIGVDAAELSDQRPQVRFLALMSRRFAFTTLFRQKVSLTFDWERRDTYGRLLAYVSFRRGMFNEYIIRQGFASALLRFPYREDYRRRFQEAEKAARTEERGVWRPEPYPLVDDRDAHGHAGRLVRVRFFCARVEEGGGFRFLHARSSDFSALIDRDDLGAFPAPDELAGRELVVSGFLELYRGRPQLHLFLPMQIRIPDHPMSPSGVRPPI